MSSSPSPNVEPVGGGLIAALVMAVALLAAVLLNAAPDSTPVTLASDSPTGLSASTSDSSSGSGSSGSDGGAESSDQAGEQQAGGDAGDGSGQSGGAQPDGQWAALFVSDPSRGVAESIQAQLQARLARPIDVFASSGYRSLRSGYWVAAVRGLPSSGRALGICSVLGRNNSDQCAARRLLNGPDITWDSPPGSGSVNPDYIAFPN